MSSGRKFTNLLDKLTPSWNNNRSYGMIKCLNSEKRYVKETAQSSAFPYLTLSCIISINLTMLPNYIISS